MKCEKETVDHLRERAIEIYSDISGKEIKEDELTEAILGIVGEDHKDAMTDTKNCLEFYVANLTNSSARGPSLASLKELNSSVFDEIVTNDVVNNITKEKLARKYRSNAKNYGDLNEKQIEKIDTHNYKIEKNKLPTILKWIQSTAEFTKFLNNKHEASKKFLEKGTNKQNVLNGTISAYTDFMKRAFNACESNQDRADFFVKHVDNLQKIYGLGPALAANFIKDLFAIELDKTDPLNNENPKDKLAEWCIKPDMHVARMMYVITGRGEYSDDLVKEKQSEVNKLYKEENPYISWPRYGKNDKTSAEVRIICDVYALAKAAECTPLEIDRLLYLCGSGNFGKKGDAQTKRYKTLLRDIHKEA